MSAEKWRVNWDNGASACGTFSQEYDTEAEAQDVADAWVAEMRAADPPTAEDIENGDTYFAEPVRVEP